MDIYKEMASIVSDVEDEARTNLDLVDVFFVYKVMKGDPNSISELFDVNHFDHVRNLAYECGLGGNSLNVLICDDVDVSYVDVIVNNKELFNVNPILLLDFPESSVNKDFESIFFECDRMSYSRFLDEVELNRRINEKFVNAEMSVYDKERSHYVRKDGTVKDYDPESNISDEAILEE